MKDLEFTASTFRIENWPTMSEDAADRKRKMEETHTVRPLP
jgi:hypothetical protein